MLSWKSGSNRILSQSSVNLAQYLLPCWKFVIKPTTKVSRKDSKCQLTPFNEYGTPVVPICKVLQLGDKMTKLRVCGDYSVTVNPHLEIHRHPLPLPEDLVRKLSSGYYFTKIDLANAYNQIRLAPESQKRLALSTHRGVLLQTRLPFGISLAPVYFQEIMEGITCDLEGVAVYLDDILVSGFNEEEHLKNLQSLLQRLRDKGLRCCQQKCVFAQPSIEYLGYTISEEGISKGKRKVDTILDMPAPTNVSSLRSFFRFYSILREIHQRSIYIDRTTLLPSKEGSALEMGKEGSALEMGKPGATSLRTSEEYTLYRYCTGTLQSTRANLHFL